MVGALRGEDAERCLGLHELPPSCAQALNDLVPEHSNRSREQEDRGASSRPQSAGVGHVMKPGVEAVSS